ncbi:hypothetical protein B0O80DRAFT_28693 [Mortierella sp. GBAus27b]|nr:hypothetical protein B0O80DRAFT_28693 [Mortierella sp. GBAus27b]
MRADHCMTTNDDGSLMIIYGGRPSNGGAFSGEVFILDTNTLAWRSGVPGPPRVYTTCTVAGDQLLVWGGMSADAAYAPVQVFIYSITSNTWITQYTPPKSYVDIRATESPPAPGPQPTGSGSNGGTVTNPGGTTATDSKSNAGAIAGGVVGGVAAICCIILFFVFRRRRQHRPLPLKNTSDQDEPKPSSPPPPPPPPLSERDEELLRMRTQLQNQQEQLDLQRRLLHLQQQQQQLNIIQQPQPQPVQYQYQDPAYGYQPPIIYSNAPPTSGSPLHSNYSNPITSGVHSSPETLHVNHGLVTSIGSPGVPPPPHTGYADCAGQYVEAHAMTPLTYAHPTAVALPPKSAGAKNDGAYWEDRPPGNPHAVIEAS